MKEINDILKTLDSTKSNTIKDIKPILNNRKNIIKQSENLLNLLQVKSLSNKAQSKNNAYSKGVGGTQDDINFINNASIEKSSDLLKENTKYAMQNNTDQLIDYFENKKYKKEQKESTLGSVAKILAGVISGGMSKTLTGKQ